jgi:hypothetical protein
MASLPVAWQCHVVCLPDRLTQLLGEGLLTSTWLTGHKAWAALVLVTYFLMPCADLRAPICRSAGSLVVRIKA